MTVVKSPLRSFMMSLNINLRGNKTISSLFLIIGWLFFCYFYIQNFDPRVGKAHIFRMEYA